MNEVQSPLNSQGSHMKDDATKNTAFFLVDGSFSSDGAQCPECKKCMQVLEKDRVGFECMQKSVEKKSPNSIANVKAVTSTEVTAPSSLSSGNVFGNLELMAIQVSIEERQHSSLSTQRQAPEMIPKLMQDIT